MKFYGLGLLRNAIQSVSGGFEILHRNYILIRHIFQMRIVYIVSIDSFCCQILVVILALMWLCSECEKSCFVVDDLIGNVMITNMRIHNST